jgi:CBS domain-containing protein
MLLEQVASLTMREIPSREPVRVPPEARLGDTVSLMRNLKQGAALVVERGSLIGIFTEHDLLRRVDHKDLAWRDKPVSEVMTPRPMIIRETDSIAEALRRMDHGRHRHLPILRGREPVAIVSVRDILAYLTSRFPADFINLPPTPEKEAREPYGG